MTHPKNSRRCTIHETFLFSTLFILMSLTSFSCASTSSQGAESQSTFTESAAVAQHPSKIAEAGSAVQRKELIEELEAMGITDKSVLTSMGKVKRHHFVPDKYHDSAYRNIPLPIGEGQTISQPFIVGLMSQLLGIKPGDNILEVGTGSGYQAAVLAEMGVRVHSIEIVPVLANSARVRLDELGYEDVKTRTGDGYLGWQEAAPFDGIIVTAAPDHFPPSLREQLKPTGHMVIPVGPTGSVQTLWLVEQKDGEWIFLNQGAVTFVPLVR